VEVTPSASRYSTRTRRLLTPPWDSPSSRPPRFILHAEPGRSHHAAYWNGVVAQYLTQPLPQELKALLVMEQVLQAQLLRARLRALKDSSRSRTTLATLRRTASLLKRRSEP
jgi:hypothetical protein